VLRTRWITSASNAKLYYQVSDYYAKTAGDWLGRGAEMLGLRGEAKKEDFFALCDNLDPRTGLPLTTHTRDGRRIGMDFNFNSTKSVGIIREMAGEGNRGDARVETAHREAVAYAMRHIEQDMRGRVRVGGKDEDRVTGNMVAMRVTHRDTRISGEDSMPDMSLHDHVVVFNATYDAVEQKWKAAQIAPIKHDGPYYEAIYHNRLATNLRALGYGIRRKGKSFEIEGVCDALVMNFSRRRKYIDKVAAKLGISGGAARDSLGASTRLGKATETAADLNAYWRGRLTDSEKRELTQLIGKPSYVSNEREAVEFAIAHRFERNSVVDERRLYEAAIRYGIGSVTPEAVREEAIRQGVLTRDGEATTRDVLAEETRIIRFAREGRGAMTRSGRDGAGHQDAQFDLLSEEQRAICRHVWDSPDQVLLIRGAAGTGKTKTMRAAIDGIDKPVVVLAPSADASRGVLRSVEGGGFHEAETVARFLLDEPMQEKARGGILWIDEAGLLGIRQVSQVFEVAGRLGARVILQGDRRQHGSVERGAVLRVLEEFAGLPVAELRHIWRQGGRYRSVVQSLAKGDTLGGYEKLSALGWIRKTEGHGLLVDDYLASRDAGKSALVIAPTHLEGEGVTAAIREKLKDRGFIGTKERVYERLIPLGWTAAQREDPAMYEGTEIVQFHRNSGPYKAGQRIEAADFRLGNFRADHYDVYQRATLAIAAGEIIRITSNTKDKTGRHKLNNGSTYNVKGFTRGGEIVLSNGWTLAKDFGHLAHGYVTTSHAAQGKTVDRVLIAMGSDSIGAISAEQFYVSVSRGRDSATIYSDLDRDELRNAIQRMDGRKSATELMGPPKAPAKEKRRTKLQKFMKRMADAYRQLRERTSALLRRENWAKELTYERQ
jgi:conjugative relaxase-like TrwC/TraI family protein